MTRILLKNGTIYSGHGPIKNGWLYIEAGKIIALGDGSHPASDIILDANQYIVIPGFIDLHVHGACGYSTMQTTPQALQTMAQFFAQHGVTSFLAATLTSSSESIMQALENIALCMGNIPNGAKLLGAYLEGPYINLQAKGAHNPSHIRRANQYEYQKFFETKAVKQMTIAPEYEENIQLIKDCIVHEVMPAVGHTTATYEQTCYAIDLGAQQSTHTFNAMSGIHHRAPGAAGAVLTHPGVTCEIIADFVHVHPAILSMAIRAKGTDKIVLVTDAEAGAGLQPGRYIFGDSPMNVTTSGVYLENGTLAGSVLTMNKALYNCVQRLGFSLEDAWPMTSYNAARQLGLSHKKGKLAVGYDADIVVLNAEDYSVEVTICEGEIVHAKNKPRD